MAEYVRTHRCYNALRDVSLADWDRGVRAIEAETRDKAMRQVVASWEQEREARELVARAASPKGERASAQGERQALIYLPLDCPVCGRHRVEWDGRVLRCEKCTTSSEWDGFSKERYAAASVAPGLDVERLANAIHPANTGPLVDCCLASVFRNLYPDDAEERHRHQHLEQAQRLAAAYAEADREVNEPNDDAVPDPEC
jgi:hypothetical protein